LYGEEFIRSYRGILILLMQKHVEFQVVTPRTLADFRGETLILPDVRIFGDSEKNWAKEYVRNGRTLIVTGADATQLAEGKNIVRFPHCPGKAYVAAMEADFEGTVPDSQADFLGSLKAATPLSIEGSPKVATSVARVDGKLQVFFANFSGLKGGVNPIQTPVTGTRITLPPDSKGKAFFLPFLGDVQELNAVRTNVGLTFALPPITKGAVFWYDGSPL
jgi:hypothetical protein